jgi:hypothetical protein
MMGCILVIVSILVPRGVILLLAVFTNWLQLSFTSLIWPVLGFLILPYTTLAYVGAMMYNNHTVSGVWFIIILAAVLADISGQRKLKR